MRLLVMVILASAVAWAEMPTVVIQPFTHGCLDAASLAERVRAELPDAEVSVGSPPAGAHQLVRVSAERNQWRVQLSLRNQRQQVVGSDERLLPMGEDCTTVLETAALIIARAATPLAFRPPPPRRPPRTQESRPPPANRPPPPSENRTVSESPPSPSPAPALSESRTSAEARRPSEDRPPVETRRSAPSDNRTAVAAAPPRRQHRLELEAAALWSFPLDGPPSTPGGELAVGWRWPIGKRLHLGLGLRAGVSGEWTASTTTAEGVVTVSARRIPFSAELRLDVHFPRAWGVIRISAGPGVAVWVAHSSGLPRPGEAAFAQPTGEVRLAYRLEWGRLMVTAGVALEGAFVRDDLTVGGVGRVAQTPVILLSPFLGAGVGFF